MNDLEKRIESLEEEVAALKMQISKLPEEILKDHMEKEQVTLETLWPENKA